MRLHLASLDFPEREFGYVPDYIQDENRTFDTERVLIDNHQFRNCKFVRCTFVYSGGPFGFDGCEIDASTTLVLTGSAHRAAILWKAFADRPERYFPPVS